MTVCLAVPQRPSVGFSVNQSLCISINEKDAIPADFYDVFPCELVFIDCLFDCTPFCMLFALLNCFFFFSPFKTATQPPVGK